LLSIDMNELESKKQVICKEKEETEQKRALILSSVSDNLKLDDSTVQEEAFLTVKIARMQERLNISNERRRDHISRVAQLTLEIEISKKGLEERHKFEEVHEKKKKRFSHKN